MVNEGVLLVSPGIFKDFVKLHKDIDSWETVQKKFLKLALHERTEGGLNVHQYRVSGNNNNATIMALVLKVPLRRNPPFRRTPQLADYAAPITQTKRIGRACYAAIPPYNLSALRPFS